MRLLKSIFINPIEKKLRFGFRILIFFILFAIIYNIVLFLIAKFNLIFFEKLIWQFLIFICLAITIFVIIYYVERKKAKDFGIILEISHYSVKSFNDGGVLAIIIILSLFLINLIIGYFTIGGYYLINANFLREGLYFLLVAITEELAFRGYLLFVFFYELSQRRINEIYKINFAALFSAIIFGVAHFFNPEFSIISFVNITLVGWFLGIITLRDYTLYYCIAFHFAWNFFQGTVFGLPVSGFQQEYSLLKVNIKTYSSFFNGGKFGIEASYILTIILVFFIIFINKSLLQNSLNKSEVK